jgi:hypothetical protein
MSFRPTSVIDERDLADQLHEAIALVELINMATRALYHDREQQNALQMALFDLSGRLASIENVLSGEVEERSDWS